MNVKRFLAIVLCTILMLSLLTSCALTKKEDTSSEGTETTAPGEIAKPKMMEITTSAYFGEPSDYPDYKEEWPKLMQEEYGIEFKVNSPARNTYTEKVNLMLTSGEVKGMVLVFTTDDLIRAVEDGVAEPLDEYLKDNEVWKSLPNEFKEMYKIDGKIYAIPQGAGEEMFVRSIRLDWLENLGLGVPETIDELDEALRAFTFNDPDGNGKNDTYGHTASSTWNLQDIFMAYDCRLNYTGESQFAYDPNLKCWTDAMLRPGMIDALNFLAKHYKDNVLDQEVFTNAGSHMRERVMSGKYGSTFYWYHWTQSFEEGTKTNDPNAKFTSILALKGPNATKNINHTWYQGSPFILVKGTPQAKEVVNWFVNIFYGDLKGHLMGRLGILGPKGFDIEGNTIILHDIGDKKTAPASNIVFEVPWFSRVDYPYRYEMYDDAWHEETNRTLIKKANDMATGKANGTLFFLPTTLQVPNSNEFARLDADCRKIYREALVKAVTGELTPEAAIENYRAQMKAIGAQKILEDANASLGIQNTFKY